MSHINLQARDVPPAVQEGEMAFLRALIQRFQAKLHLQVEELAARSKVARARRQESRARQQERLEKDLSDLKVQLAELKAKDDAADTPKGGKVERALAYVRARKETRRLGS